MKNFTSKNEDEIFKCWVNQLEILYGEKGFLSLF